MDNNTILIGLSVVLVIIIIGLIIHQRSAPSIVGYSVKHAEEILLESGKPYRLGNKVGFLQPKKGDFNLLGKIAEQYIIPLENNKYAIDYKVYQIDVGEMDSALFPNKEIEQKKIQEIQQVQQIQEHAKREAELQRLTKEREEIIEREKAYKEQAAREAQMEAAAREQAERNREVEMEEARRQAEWEQQERSKHMKKQKKSNSLEFVLPDKDSDVRYHGSKESFFW
jgi:hypothetical protein